MALSPSTEGSSEQTSLREELRDGRRFLYYDPSGLVGWSRFIPLVSLLLVAVGLAAWLLTLLESDFYYYFFTPLIVSAPVLGLLVVIIRWGRCRHPLIGAVVGCLAMMSFYGGYWQMSFHRFVTQPVEDPSEQVARMREVERIGGRMDVFGYFFYRNRTTAVQSGAGASPREPRAEDAVFSYLLHGLEFVILVGIGLGIGLTQAGRVYFEGRNRWANRDEFLIPADGALQAVQALETSDWESLAAIPRVPAFGRQANPRLALVIEHAPGDPSAGLFVSLTGSNMGRLAPPLADVGHRRLLAHHFVEQLYVPPRDAAALVELMPELAQTV